MSDPFDMEGPIVLAPKGEGTEEGSYDPFDMEGPIGAPTPEPMWTYPAEIAYNNPYQPLKKQRRSCQPLKS